MLTPHFFKARSRIGIVNKPFHQKENNIGVELGADFILEENFLKIFDKYSISSFDFPLPEDISEGSYFEVFRNSINDFSNFINDELKEERKQMVIGGDHIVSLGSVLAVMKRVRDRSKIGYVHFDSHADINKFHDSPSNNFHGMYLRPLFDKFDIKLIDELVPDKIPARNAMFIGNLDLDPGEEKFIKENNIKSISRSDLTENKEQALQMFENFINNLEYLHVSFDGDVLDRTIFNATGIPAEDGFMLDEVMDLISIISGHKNLTFDIAEFNPLKKGVEESKKICQQILKRIITV